MLLRSRAIGKSRLRARCSAYCVPCIARVTSGAARRMRISSQLPACARMDILLSTASMVSFSSRKVNLLAENERPFISSVSKGNWKAEVSASVLSEVRKTEKLFSPKALIYTQACISSRRSSLTISALSFRNAVTFTRAITCGAYSNVSLGAPSMGLMRHSVPVFRPNSGKVEKKVNSTSPISCSHRIYSLAKSRTIGVRRLGVKTHHTATETAIITTATRQPSVMPNIFRKRFIGVVVISYSSSPSLNTTLLNECSRFTLSLYTNSDDVSLVTV